jgi:hypothetical protein
LRVADELAEYVGFLVVDGRFAAVEVVFEVVFFV